MILIYCITNHINNSKNGYLTISRNDFNFSKFRFTKFSLKVLTLFIRYFFYVCTYIFIVYTIYTSIFICIINLIFRGENNFLPQDESVRQKDSSYIMYRIRILVEMFDNTKISLIVI